jgi:hypothetical protein
MDLCAAGPMYQALYVLARYSTLILFPPAGMGPKSLALLRRLCIAGPMKETQFHSTDLEQPLVFVY